MEKRGKEQSHAYLFLWVMLGAVLLAVFLNSFVCINAYVPSGSMIPTISEKALIISSRLDHDYEQGDVVLFRRKEVGKELLCKRIIAGPGDTVSIQDGTVYVNETALEEDYVTTSWSGDMETILLQDEQYFVMGDNRNNSKDCRHWDIPYVEEDAIKAVVKVQYYPNWKIIDKKEERLKL